MVRKTSASVKAYRELKTLIQNTLKTGEMAIPSERTLASTFGVSRMTLRKALARALDEKLLYRAGTSYVVARQPQLTTSPNSPRATLVFAAMGIDIPANRVWARVASHLSRLCQTSQVSLKLLLLRPGFIFRHQCLDISQIPDCNAMVVAQDAAKAIPLNLWVERKHTPLIATEAIRPKLTSAVAWDTIGCDHFYVGQQGAQYLVDQGCQKPLYVGWELNEPYQPFIQRERGFIARLGGKADVMKVGLNPLDTRTPAADRERQFAHLIPQIISGQYDGIFIQADEHLRFFVDALAAYGPLPHLVSILGNGELNEHALPVAYFDHAEKQVAARIFQRLEQILTGEAKEVVEQWVQPDLHVSHWLGHPQNALTASGALQNSFQLLEV